MKTLNCSCGKTILLDDDVYEELKHIHFHCTDGRVKADGHGRSPRPIAWFVLKDIPHYLVPDHVDRDFHNNLRSNLRLATQSQNMANRGIQKNNTSGCRGVFLDKRRVKWIAQVKKEGKVYRSGPYLSKKQAAEAYNRMSLRLFGEFAYLNDTSEILDE